MIDPLERNVRPGATEGHRLLPISDLLLTIRKRLWLIVSVTVVVAGTAVGFSLLQTPQYQASIEILVGQDRGTGMERAPSSLQSDVQGLQALAGTVVEAVKSRPVAQGAIESLGSSETPESILANLSAEQVGETQFVRVSYQNPDPEQAKEVVDAIGEEFSKQVLDISPSANAITAVVWESAVMPGAPVSPDPMRDGLLALVLGGMLGVGLAVLLEYMANSRGSAQEDDSRSEVPTLGSIPAAGKARRNKEKVGRKDKGSSNLLGGK
jgi:capsular polysaccharide biosynthesis protein